MNNAKALQDLSIAWQSLLSERAHARPGTKERRDLDNLYYQILPKIRDVSESVDEDEQYKLVQNVSALLRTNFHTSAQQVEIGE